MVLCFPPPIGRYLNIHLNLTSGDELIYSRNRQFYFRLELLQVFLVVSQKSVPVPY